MFAEVEQNQGSLSDLVFFIQTGWREEEMTAHPPSSTTLQLMRRLWEAQQSRPARSLQNKYFSALQHNPWPTPLLARSNLQQPEIPARFVRASDAPHSSSWVLPLALH